MRRINYRLASIIITTVFLLCSLPGNSEAQDSPFTEKLRQHSRNLTRIFNDYKQIEKVFSDPELMFVDAPGGQVRIRKGSEMIDPFSSSDEYTNLHLAANKKWREHFTREGLPGLLSEFEKISFDLRYTIRKNTYPTSQADLDIVNELKRQLPYFYLRKSVRGNKSDVSSSLNLENAFSEYLKPGSTDDMSQYYEEHDTRIREQISLNQNSPFGNYTQPQHVPGPAPNPYSQPGNSNTATNPNGSKSANLITGTWQTKGSYGNIFLVEIGFDRTSGGYRAVIAQGNASLPVGTVIWGRIKFREVKSAWGNDDPSKDYLFTGYYSKKIDVPPERTKIELRLSHDYPSGSNKYNERMVPLGYNGRGLTGGFFTRVTGTTISNNVNAPSNLRNNKTAVIDVVKRALQFGLQGNFMAVKGLCSGEAARSMDKAIRWKQDNYFEYSIATGFANSITAKAKQVTFKGSGDTADVSLNIGVPAQIKQYVASIRGIRMKIVAKQWKIVAFY